MGFFNLDSSVQVFLQILKSQLIPPVKTITNEGLCDDSRCDPWDYKERMTNEYSACSDTCLRQSYNSLAQAAWQPLYKSDLTRLMI